MERNFDNRDFEQYLKKNADQYRMYPSEKVWVEIHNSIHPRRRWMGITALLLLITGAIVTTIMLPGPGSSVNKTPTPLTSLSPVTKKPDNKTTSQKNNTASESILKPVNTRNPIAANKIPSIIGDNTDINNQAKNILITQPALTAVVTVNENNKPELLQTAGYFKSIAEEINPERILSLSFKAGRVNDEAGETLIQPQKPAVVPAKKQNTFTLLSTAQNRPGSAVAQSKTKKKIGFQVYFTPGISYRRLTENKEVILAASGGPSIPTNLALQDVKNVVTHKPDAGFELGLAAKYPLSKRIIVKTGLQFNVNKYDIRAFSYSGEPATIAIQGGTIGQQTVIRTSYYRNASGYRPNWLTNVYFSLSVPVGAEIKILDGKKVDLGFGITGQPTYLLDNRAYMISTDYKNYVKIPDLMRRWNINTGAEIIVSIKSKRTNWSIGPQVRYQVLSSFKDKYPVNENLFNFGLKAGIMLNH